MQTKRVILIVSLLCSLLLAASCGKSEKDENKPKGEVAGDPAKTITLRADVWCPYNCEPGSDRPGYMVEIAREVFAAQGLTVQYDKMPWARAIQESRAGKFTGILGAYKEDAPDFVFPAESLGASGNVFFVKKGDAWRYKGIKSLSGKSVGIIRDYSYGAKLDKYFKQHAGKADRVQVVSGDDALALNVRKLLAGRVNTVIEDRNVMSYFLAKTNQPGVVESAGREGIEPVYIAFSPKLPEGAAHAKTLSDGIARLRSAGKLKPILDKYGVSDWK